MIAVHRRMRAVYDLKLEFCNDNRLAFFVIVVGQTRINS